MTGEVLSGDRAKLETVRCHLFDMDGHLTRADEALVAMSGLVDVENPARYKAAVNCVVDVLYKQIKNLRESWEPAFEMVREAAPALADKVEAGLTRAERGCHDLKQSVKE